jgi:DNA primase
MNEDTHILSKLISDDFGLDSKDGSRWGKSKEHSSLVLDKERGIFYWNSEGIVGDPLVYLMRVRKLSFEQAKEFLKELTYTGTHVYTIYGKDKEDVVVYPKLVDIFFDDGLNNREYFYIRGLTDETIDRFQLGYWNNFATVPFFVDGTFRNFQLRKDVPRIIKSYYKGIGPLLFNSDILKLTNRIFIAEGPIDALILTQNGIPAVSTNSGGTMLPEWFFKFIYQDEIVILFDNDKAGLLEARKVAKMLGVNRCKIYLFSDFEENGYDPVDFYRDGYTTDELNNLIATKAKYLYEM